MLHLPHTRQRGKNCQFPFGVERLDRIVKPLYKPTRLFAGEERSALGKELLEISANKYGHNSKLSDTRGTRTFGTDLPM